MSDCGPILHLSLRATIATPYSNGTTTIKLSLSPISSLFFFNRMSMQHTPVLKKGIGNKAGANSQPEISIESLVKLSNTDVKGTFSKNWTRVHPSTASELKASEGQEQPEVLDDE